MVCCHVSDDECYVRQGLTGTRFQLFVSGRFSGYQGQNTPEQAPLHTEHKVGGETLALVETIVLITYKS